jgi:hypothetical protein
MGLRERRRIQELENETKQIQEELKKLVGSTIEFTYDWPTFEKHPEALEYVLGRGPGMVRDVLAAIAYDDMGKQAVAAGVKKVHTVNLDDKNGVGHEFAGGLLTVRGAFQVYSEGFPDSTALQRTLEDNL